MPCAVILTAIPVEYMAVRAYLTELEERVHPQGTVYEEGKFSANNQVWNVGIAEIGAGNPGAAGQAERAIAYFNPQVILFPVIVDLSDWQPTVSLSNYRRSRISQQNFSEEELVKSIPTWLISKVSQRYGFSPQQIQQWLEEKQLVPLLDGLDEVSPEYQQYCLQAINL